MSATSDRGWMFLNPDTGVEWSNSHPVRSGECPDALHIRRATENEDWLARSVKGLGNENYYLRAVRDAAEGLHSFLAKVVTDDAEASPVVLKCQGDDSDIYAKALSARLQTLQEALDRARGDDAHG